MSNLGFHRSHGRSQPGLASEFFARFQPRQYAGRSCEILPDQLSCVPNSSQSCFSENTYAWQELAKAGIVADSQTATLFQPYLEPLMHWTGIARFPIFFEDDIFFELNPLSLDLDPVLANSFTPGLKILNFHATFVACNIPSREYYEQARSRIFGTQAMADDILWKGRGTADVLDEFISKVLASGCVFKTFEQVVDDVLAHVKKNRQRFPLFDCTTAAQANLPRP